MISYLESSAIYKSSLCIVNIFKNSILYRVFLVLGTWYANSTTHKTIDSYLTRKSTSQFTLTYRILSFIGRKIDSILGKLHSFFLEQIQSSGILHFMDAVNEEGIRKPSQLLITGILTFTAGFCIVNTIRNLWAPVRFELILLLCLVCVILAVMSGKWKFAIKNSFFIKLYHFIWE